MENYRLPVMARIMRAWFERYRYHHPTSRDFEKVVNEVSGQDMSWFFDQFVFGTDQLDYRVDSVSSPRSPYGAACSSRRASAWRSPTRM